MDLSLFRDYLATVEQVDFKLRAKRQHLASDSAFALYKAIASKGQSCFGEQLLCDFIKGFNWQVSFVSCNEANSKALYQIMSLLPQMTPEQTLKFGIHLFFTQWGSQGEMNFQQFSQFTHEKQALPNSSAAEPPFASLKNLFELLMLEINGLIKIEAFKKAVYHEYGNKTDLFEMLSTGDSFGPEQVKDLFLTFSERKDSRSIEGISTRIGLPWTFKEFLSHFKAAGSRNSEKDYKINYSCKRNKGGSSTPNEHSFTTPRRPKENLGFSSTKATKAQMYSSLMQQSKRVAESEETHQERYVSILTNILSLEEDFVRKCSALVMKEDLDLELVYERHGKKFESILNTRYGVCNFSAFVRFFVPKDYEHRYLAFIRYQASNKLTPETEKAILDLIQSYNEKEMEIQKAWGSCDREFLLRSFCPPRETVMKVDKLKDYFTEREANILRERFDPCKQGFIGLTALL